MLLYHVKQGQNRVTFLLICKSHNFQIGRFKTCSERLRRKTIINYVLTTKKKKKALLKAFRQDLELPCTLLYVNREVNNLYLKRFTEWEERKGLHANFLIHMYITENSYTHTHRYIQQCICFFQSNYTITIMTIIS